MSKLPEGWELTTVGAINRFSSRAINPKSAPDIEYELYSVPAFPTRQPEILRGLEIGSTKQAVEPGDVLICKINPRINRVWIVGPKRKLPQIASSEWIAVRAPELDPRFLQHYFSSSEFRQVIEDGVSGVGGSLTRAQPKRVATFSVPVAPRAEQERIADKLAAVLVRIEGCRERLTRIPAILKRFREAVFEAAVTGELTKEWRDLHPDAPSWQTFELNELCRSITDGDHQAPPQSTDGIPFITISAINDGQLRLDKATRYVPHAYFNGLKAERKAEIGDILFSVTGSIAIPALVDTSAKFAFQRHIAILKPDLDKVSSHFLLHSLSSQGIKSQSRAVATGTAQLTIPLSGLRAFELGVPGAEEQAEIVRHVSELLSYASEAERQLSLASGRSRNDNQTSPPATT